jgi:site-specific recombinase XerD
MNAAHYKIILRDLPANKSDKKAIYLYCLINGVKKYYSLKVFIDLAHFDPDTQRVTKNCPDYITINLKIKSFINTAEGLVNAADNLKQKASLIELDELLRLGNYDRQSFTEFIKKDIEQFKSNYTYNTIRKYKSVLAILQAYKGNIPFIDVGPVFWRKYEQYLKQRGNNQNTVQKAFAVLNVFLNRAVASEVIKINPLANIKVSKGESRLKYLTIDELGLLEALYKTKLSTQHERTLLCFLFCCYTGLRFSDIKDLKYKNIENNSHIVTKMKKVKKTVRIPLSNFAMELLPVVENPLPEMNVFRVYSNQPMNRYLKQIAKNAGIKKDIGFHYSRHTFGTCSIEKGIDVYTVKEIMGHSNVVTTQIYAKVTSTLIDKEMEKWNK